MKALILLRKLYLVAKGKFSPHALSIAYQSAESGKLQIYVLPASGNAGKWMISTDGGTRVRWSRDGKRIYYTSPDSKLMAVDVNTRGDEFVAGTPRLLFPINFRLLFGEQYDVAADGKRFLINTPIQQSEVPPIT